MQRAQLFSHISNDSLFSLASFLGMSFICRPLENFLFVIINNKLHRMRKNSLICFGLPLLLTIVMFTYLHLHLELISFNVLKTFCLGFLLVIDAYWNSSISLTNFSHLFFLGLKLWCILYSGVSYNTYFTKFQFLHNRRLTQMCYAHLIVFPMNRFPLSLPSAVTMLRGPGLRVYSANVAWYFWFHPFFGMPFGWQTN